MRYIILAIATATIFIGCGGAPTTTTTSTSEPKRVLTKSTKAIAQSVDLKEVFTSEIIAYKENNITPAANGVRIDKIYFDIGDKVNQGELVATLDPTQYNQQMITVDHLRLDYQRLLPVYESGGVSKQVIDQAKSALDVQEEIARNLKKNIELHSPISGVVTERNSEEGDLFINQPILHIAHIDKVKVRAQISEQHFPQVRVGMPVELSVDIYPNELFTGSVSLIYPTLNSESRTFTVEVTIPNRSMLLRPGMYGHTSFNLGSKPGVMIPDIAIQKQFGSAESFIYVVEDGEARRRRITRGRQVGDLVDILSGVDVGDEVITTAFSRISDGTTIEIKK